MVATGTSGRLLSLDVFRGATIAAMILVNNPGSWSHVLGPLAHAEWHGWTPTDLVFPFFLFIVGVAIVFAYRRRLDEGVLRAPLVRKLVVRSAVLFALGLLLAAFPFQPDRLASIRIPGVLQRIAVCYLGASLLFLFCRPRTWKALIPICLLGYWALMMWVPVPGHGAGAIDGVDTHLAAYIDRLLLAGHLWSQARTWDPEGILSTIPALATCLFGMIAGEVLRSSRDATSAVLGLFVRGSALVALGYVWSWFFPINKPIWTSSYAVFTAGQAMCALALCHWLIEVKGYRAWTRPFVIYGVNSITVFVGSGLLARTLDVIEAKPLIYDNLLASWLPPHAASLAYALCWITGWYAVLSFLYRREIVIRV